MISAYPATLVRVRNLVCSDLHKIRRLDNRPPSEPGVDRHSCRTSGLTSLHSSTAPSVSTSMPPASTSTISPGSRKRGGKRWTYSSWKPNARPRFVAAWEQVTRRSSRHPEHSSEFTRSIFRVEGGGTVSCPGMTTSDTRSIARAVVSELARHGTGCLVSFRKSADNVVGDEIEGRQEVEEETQSGPVMWMRHEFLPYVTTGLVKAPGIE